MSASVDLRGIRATDLIVSSPTLWWAILVDAAVPLDVLALGDYYPNHLSNPFQERMLFLVDRLASGKELKSHLHHHHEMSVCQICFLLLACGKLHHHAAADVKEFGLDLHAMSTEIFLMVPSGDEDTSQPYLCVPLLYGLSHWGVGEKNKNVPSAPTRTPGTSMPGLAPLKEKQWVAELMVRPNALVFPGLPSRIALKEVAFPNAGASESATPMWLEMLTTPELGAAHSNFMDAIDCASFVPDAHAQHVAHFMRVFFQDEGICESLTAPLGKVTSAKVVVAGLQCEWLSAPNPKQHVVRSHVQRIVVGIEAQYASGNAISLQAELPRHIDPLVTRARTTPRLS